MGNNVTMHGRLGKKFTLFLADWDWQHAWQMGKPLTACLPSKLRNNLQHHVWQIGDNWRNVLEDWRINCNHHAGRLGTIDTVSGWAWRTTDTMPGRFGNNWYHTGQVGRQLTPFLVGCGTIGTIPGGLGNNLQRYVWQIKEQWIPCLWESETFGTIPGRLGNSWRHVWQTGEQLKSCLANWGLIDITVCLAD